MKKGVSMPYAKYILADFLMFEFSVVLLTMKVTIFFLQEVCVYEERVVAMIIAEP